MHEYLGGIARGIECIAIEVGGVADHVHMLARVHPSVAVADLVRVLKANSSKWMHEEIGETEFAWQRGYAAFSVSQSNADAVWAYIRRQEAHHLKRGFKEELIGFFARHGVSCDERYVWA